MSTTAKAKRKIVSGPERTAALTAASFAGRKHKHVGLRPARPDRGQDLSSEGIYMPTDPLSLEFDRAMNRAGEDWPDADNWEVIGADNFDWGNDDCTGDGLFGTPNVYGEFRSMSDEEVEEELGGGPG